MTQAPLEGEGLELPDEPKLAVPGFSLFSVGQISGATFVGSPLAGAYMLAQNFRRLDAPKKSTMALVLGTLSTIALFFIGYFLPDGFLNALLPASYTGAMAALARNRQGTAIQDHFARGGVKASFGHAALVGTISLVLVVVVFFSVVLSIPEDKVVFGPNDEVYFQEGATEQDARTFGKFMQDAELFTGDSAFSIYLERKGTTTVVSFVVVDGTWNDPEMVEAFQDVTNQLSGEHVFEDVEVKLIDEWLTTQTTLSPKAPEFLRINPVSE